jgi:hypothetical protein
MIISRIVFELEIPWTGSTGRAPHQAPVHRGPTTIAALGAPPELGLRPLRGSRSPRKGRGRWKRSRRACLWAHWSSRGGEMAARWRGMAGDGRCSVTWGLQTRERAKEGGGECGDGRVCSSPFYRG